VTHGMWCGTKRKHKSFRLGSEKFCNFSCLREEVQFPLFCTRGLPVVYTNGITQPAGDTISFGSIGISEIARSLP
jgi:hypothetical protein